MKSRIIQYPSKVLRQISNEVKDFSSDLEETINIMSEQKKLFKGIGIAAIQVGIPLRIIIVQRFGDPYTWSDLIMINPVITKYNNEKVDSFEGCLSVGDGLACKSIKRSKTVKVKYQDQSGQFNSEEFSDMTSIICQHEIDHLDGILFIDHLSKLKKDLFLKKHKLQKEFKVNE